MGTTQSGNLLYGREGLDITEELLEALNRDYNGVGYGEQVAFLPLPRPLSLRGFSKACYAAFPRSRGEG